MGAYSAVVTTAVASTEQAGGGVAWTNPQYASVYDGTDWANVSLAGSDLSNWINSTTYTTWPVFTSFNCTITGLKCSVYCVADISDQARITHCQITAGGVQIAFSSDLACSKPIKDGWDYSEIGGDGEMWGLTDAQMKAFIQQKFQGFRFEVEEETGIATVVDVDGMEITVYWDEYRTLASLGCGR